MAEAAHEELKEQYMEERMHPEVEGHLIIKFLKRSYLEVEFLVLALFQGNALS